MRSVTNTIDTMKKIAFFILPLIVLGILASPLMARGKISFSFNFNALPSLFMAPPPVLQERVVVARPVPPMPPTYYQQRVIKQYYAPVYQEETVIVQSQTYTHCPYHNWH